ncbi:3-keto-5-aminohexanoate cleavage protein [Sutcliffiella horikoshii]|uniref:3-keto-5-aminohexanoate cleavage protein n=1 Tax=Sutcliffiella horikoshii TaxID=79883 RepID=A0A5D4T4D0_9BACI|nr:3-keto-5-aminohexanoate cleavage protein [Sutcliffiella horikoshii]TYS69761.1 3-keto-5-aminohexanoate cleavage protein [Sutcliffiella horikoshii]
MKTTLSNHEKLIITCATTGGLHGKETNSILPEQPEEIVLSMKEAFSSGATVAHIHARDKDGIVTEDLGIYREIIQGIREVCPEMIVQVGNGLGQRPDRQFTLKDRMNLLNLDPKPDMLTINAGSFEFGRKYTFENPYRFNKEFYQGCKEKDIEVEFECYDLSHIYNVMDMADKGIIEGKIHFSFVIGVPGGIQHSAENLLRMIDIIPDNSSWQAVSIGRYHVPTLNLAICLGGNIRTGTEDTIYYRKGELVGSQSQLIERAVRIANELDREVASTSEARELLGLSYITT